MNVAIRQYEASDYDACRSLWVQLTQHHRDVYDDPEIGGDDPGSAIDEYLANPERRETWIAAVDGQVVGMGGLIVQGEEGMIEPVVVSRQYRSRGIGRQLVQHVVREAGKANVRFLGVQPVARNEQALSFFVGLGFTLLGHLDLFQDLSPSTDRKWLSSIRVHGHELRY